MTASNLYGSLVWFALASVFCAGLTDARYIRSPMAIHEEDNIPQFLVRLYQDMGRDRFEETWKAFNTRNSDQQDAFLLEDLSDSELSQLGSDFEHLAMALGEDHKLMELYANFERSLDIVSFMEMDEKLSQSGPWWIRIKKFLFRKLQKLAQEMRSL